MSSNVANAYHIECDPERDRYTAVLVNTVTHYEFRTSVCTCARQSIATATRSGTRPLPFLGAFTWNVADQAYTTPHALTSACPVRRNDWTWVHHGHTHTMKLPKVIATIDGTR